MKAYHLSSPTGISALTPIELAEPVPAAGQVVVRVRATSLNYRDLMVIAGDYGRIRTPLVPLSDGAGEIVAVGDAVDRSRIGERVAGLFFQKWTHGAFPGDAFRHALGATLPGMLAEFVALPEAGVVGIPEQLSFEEAATLPCAALTAWNALVTRGGIASDETVVLLGTGGVSIFSLQFAKMHGARVIITSSSDEKLQRARALGADETINYRATPDWEKAVLDLTGGKGAEHVFEVGGRDTFPKSLKAAAVNGTVYVIGGVAGFTAETPLRALITRNVTVRGIAVGSRAMHEAMNRAIARNKLQPVVDRAFPFAEAGKAYELLQAGGHFGKVVITL
ncbi:MAG: zinc-dependent alcohol dehydrogenase family protein [Opitutaceae bacterium]